MARSPCLPSTIFLLLALTLMANIFGTVSAVTDGTMGDEGSVPPEQCGEKCSYRCSKTQHRKPCLLYCNQCCQKCHCVPSGTYGNREECPCYNNWKTKRGTNKCP